MKRKLLALLILASLDAQARVPKGFEALTQGVEERVEVVLAGKNIGLFDATVNLDTVTFADPSAVLTALELPVVQNSADYQAILKALSAPLARNGEKACGSVSFASAGCGYLKTDNVAAIYDGEEASVTLFLRGDWMPVSGQSALYLQADKNDVENALIHQQDLNVLTQEDYSSLFLQSSDALGITENSYIGADWSLAATKNDDNSDNSTDISNLYYRYDLDRRYYLQLGRMDNRTLFSTRGGNFSFSFLPLGAIDGARVGSTLSYVNRDRASQGSPVMVLLSRNSRVDAYRNNQLLGTFYLPAGNQMLDTTQFPDGSYTISLNIYESNQLARVETAAFTKSGGMDDGRMHWFLQGGKISDNDDHGGDGNAYQAGVRVPLFRSLSLTAGGAIADDVRSVEGGVEIMPDFGKAGSPDLTVNVYHNDDGGRGDSQQLQWSAPGLPSLSLYRYSSNGEQCDVGNSSDTSSYTQLGCYENMNASLSAVFYGWNSTLSFIRTENHTNISTWQSSNTFANNVLNQTTDNAVSRTWQLSASRAWNAGAWLVNGTFGAFTRDDGGYDGRDNGLYLSLSFYLTPRQDSGYRSQSSRLSVDYRDSKNTDSQTAYRASHSWYWDEKDHKELSVEAGGINSDTLDAVLNGRYEGRYGNLSATLSDSYDNRDNSHNSAFSGAYSSSFAVSRHGVSWGGAGGSEPSAAVLVNVEDAGDDEQKSAAVLDARISGSRTVTLGAGSSALFPLMAYEPGRIDISDSRLVSQGATTAVLTGAGNSSVMLLPGKVRVKTVAAEQRYGYVGRLLLPAGARTRPVIGLNSRMLLLAEDGGFTAQLPGRADNLYLAAGSQYFQCPLTVKKRRAVVRYVGEVTCQPITEERLPQVVREKELVKLKRRNAMETAYSGKDE
ncbi:TcfC E-set like domain-containing protein [Enterobacillus tribolii]|uniref:TcfC E-set like domain-containing protein n=1 Tax=Enterobacillus tribolii TaxID=1487935 RepID=UPI000E1CD36F|nr:TcfC E-set like domain-containing protein [Enterobacillus tribolii]MBW7983877.1 hypothetical protein [Enterobacillus tribolii]